MKQMISRVLSVAVAVAAACGLGGCFVAQQMHDKKMEEQLLKPGALDPPVIERYRNYSYRFMRKYQVSHDWLADASACQYRRIWIVPSGGTASVPVRVGDIEEREGQTFQQHQDEKIKLAKDLRWLSVDQYVRSKVVFNPVDREMVETGLRPMCDQTWVASSHFLSVYLYRRTADEWRELLKRNPDGKVAVQRVGNNDWLVKQYDDLYPPPLNGAGGPFQTWVLSLGDTGYTLTLRLGASKKSLERPERHFQMQAIFKHLVESVKIEPLPGS